MTTPCRKPADKAPARMAALASLPVFFKLQGKRVVLAGGTAAAAWKAELLAAAGANVEIYATQIELELAELLERGAEQGSLMLHSRPWSLDVFEDAAMALADTVSMEEARAFYCAAVAAGIPVNVIDKPAFCQFQFGSIVNRSPVVVSISTDGAAPILGQSIRRRIETLLPPRIAEWASLAKSIRNSVNARLAPGSERRSFWETFSNLAFGSKPIKADANVVETLIAQATTAAQPGSGRVTIVGAGPGDPELLTLKAVRALQSADVILFDDLVSDEVLELARREAKRMLVGKRGGRASCKQDDINDLMVKLASQGKHVVRLKSGDPMIFGRAGEEIDRLDGEGIPVSVIPGITSGMAMASLLGTSLTHRDCAHSVRFVTGHSRSGQLPGHLDWKGLADPETTLVFYMGARTASQIAARLTENGLAPATPVVIASAVTRPNGKQLYTTLESLKTDARVAKLDGPVLIGIGQAFAKRRVEAQADREPSVLLATA